MLVRVGRTSEQLENALARHRASSRAKGVTVETRYIRPRLFALPSSRATVDDRPVRRTSYAGRTSTWPGTITAESRSLRSRSSQTPSRGSPGTSAPRSTTTCRPAGRGIAAPARSRRSRRRTAPTAAGRRQRREGCDRKTMMRTSVPMVTEHVFDVKPCTKRRAFLPPPTHPQLGSISEPGARGRRARRIRLGGETDGERMRAVRPRDGEGHDPIRLDQATVVPRPNDCSTGNEHDEAHGKDVDYQPAGGTRRGPLRGLSPLDLKSAPVQHHTGPRGTQRRSRRPARWDVAAGRQLRKNVTALRPHEARRMPWTRCEPAWNPARAASSQKPRNVKLSRCPGHTYARRTTSAYTSA